MELASLVKGLAVGPFPVIFWLDYADEANWQIILNI